MNAKDPETPPTRRLPLQGAASGVAQPWNVMVVDDHEAFHVATHLILDTAIVLGRPLQVTSAYSATEAMEILEERDDVAVLLLDLVMETETAGLSLVRWIRHDLGDHAIRIILCTGHPGATPGWRLILSHDINDYRAKKDLTADQLMMAITLALRSYQEVSDIYGRLARHDAATVR